MKFSLESRMGSARLFQTAGVDEQWEAVISPWLRAQAQLAWRDPRPTVILTPSRAESFYLRGRLIREGLSFFALRFWTPSDARSYLFGEISPQVHLASEAELRLMARMCAQELAGKSREPSLASVGRDPSLFLRAYDLLIGAGWSPAKDGAEYSRQLARKLDLLLKERKVITQAGLHRLLRQEASKKKRSLLRNLLVSGFNATHWPLWDLLRAMTSVAEAAAVSLISPREFAAEVDELWIGSWEEEIGGEAEFPEATGADRPEPFAAWVASYERGVSFDAETADITFLANADLAGQIKAVVLQTLAYLGRDSCQRLGIIFPEMNALALGVADELRSLAVPLDDGTGYWQPGPFERRTWAAWLSLQEEPSVERLVAWVRACEAGGLGFGSSLAAREIAEALEEALGETLIDDLRFLALHLERPGAPERRRPVGTFLQSRLQLAAEASFDEHLTMTRRATQELGWTDSFSPGFAEPPAWLREAGWRLSRRAFLAWLDEFTDSRQRTRGPESNHFYGKVHLLIYAQMPGQTWSHLILTGLNEGGWPRFSEAGAFGSRHELIELNRQARMLNRRGTAQGAQGAGHESVQPDRGHCLLPLERRDLALRDLCAAVEGTSHSVCLAALTTEAGRTLLPSEFFSTAYEARTGGVLDEAVFSALAKRTAQWCDQRAISRPNPAPVRISSEDMSATRTAFAARRDADKPFGRYEFAFADPPSEPVQLPCKTWETAWNHPASIWLERIVGVNAWPEGQLAWPRAVGTWVHRWLTSSLTACHEKGDVGDFLPLLRTAAAREPSMIREQMERAGVAPYPWWTHVWGQARAIALGLGESLAPHLGEHLIRSEYPLPKPGLIMLPGAARADFELRGKIDLLLIQPGAFPFDPAQPGLDDCSCWVIDFKTGAAKNLTASRMEKGIGLQAMLYALAVRSGGASSVAVSLQTSDTPLKPQVQIEQIEASFALFRSLDRLHRNGIFGLRPAPESDFGFAPEYPLATRPIPPAVLEAKWALVHGAGDWWEES